VKSLSYINQADCFPSAEKALTDPNGLLAVGGDLAPERLLEAYKRGIFPWFNPGEPILWWTPDPRAVFFIEQYQPSRSLLKTLRRQDWRFRINTHFPEVIHACSNARKGQDGTWITDDIQAAYIALHHLGHAHSFEVWQGERLIGGLYGLAMGKVFCGESMFHCETDASKAAFYFLNRYLKKQGFELIDAQVMNPHLQRLGAQTLPRNDFLRLLTHLSQHPAPSCIWQPQEVNLEF
jgi:leucyl/phenylalanyl-tRNA--protein transferase